MEAGAGSIWNDTMRIGIDACDDQRRDLAGLVELLDQTAGHSNTDEYFLGQFHTLQVVMQEYFTREEAIMDALQVPDAVKKPHVAAHEAILEMFLAIYFDSMKHVGKNAIGVYQQVRTALEAHFRDVDSQLRYFVSINT